MILTSSSNIRATGKDYAILREMCRRAGSLYNSLVYETDKHFKETRKYVGFGELDLIMKNHEENPIYRMLPAHVAQQKIKKFHESFKSFFALLKKKKSKEYDKNISTPKYKKKGHLSNLTFAAQSFRVKGNKIYLTIPKDLHQEDSKFLSLDLPLYLKDKKIKQLEIKPNGSGFKLQIMYESEQVLEQSQNIENWLSVDLGIDNLCTLTSNILAPVIVNGKPIKAINRFYNKAIAKEQSTLKKTNKLHSSKKLNLLRTQRANKIQNEFHKIASFVEELVCSSNIDTVVIGYNKNWKVGVKLGKRTNQKFVQIPYTKLVQYISYKLELKGIRVIVNEESYTSKCSYFDDEEIKKHSSYKGKRTNRGCFLTSTGIKINADVNGSLNISKKALQKVVGDVYRPADIGLVMNPVRLKLFTFSSLESINNFIVNLQIKSIKCLKV